MAEVFTVQQAWADLIRLADDVGFLPTPPGGLWWKRWGWTESEADIFFLELERGGHVFHSTGKSGHVGARLAFQLPVDHAVEFERIWEIYPKQVARTKAFHAYAATRKGRKGKHNHPPVSARELHTATMRYVNAREGEDDEFILHAATFFGPDRRWKDKHRKRTNSKAKGSQWKRPTKKDLTRTTESRTKDPSPMTKKAPTKKAPRKKDPLADL